MKRITTLLAATGLVAACSSSTPATGDGGSKDATADKAPIDAYVPACDQTKACDGDPPMGAQCIVSFDTQLVDVGGAPITSEKLFLCGTNLCTAPIAPDAQGKIHSWVCAYFVQAAAKYLGGVAYASFAAAAPTGSSVTMPALTLVALPATGADIPMNGGAVTSNMVTLTVAASAVTFDPTEPDDADLHRFRAVTVPLAKAPPGAPSGVGVVWGLGPVNAALKPAAKLTVPNSAGWPANAAVKVYLNGVDAFDAVPPVPYGGWGAIGTAHVSADGMTISTDSGPGNGLPMIGMVGLEKM